MLQFRLPSERFIREVLDRQRQVAFSYPEVGASRDQSPAGYDIDHNRKLLGQGAVVFEAAKKAVRQWKMFPGAWALIEPPNTPIEQGQVVVMLAHVFGLWWLNPCRIVYVLDETEPVRRFGFAYGTLPQHVEQGEERFSVEWLADDTVWYDLRAFSRPRYWPVRIGYPIARRLQRRFVRESLASMQSAVAVNMRQGSRRNDR